MALRRGGKTRPTRLSRRIMGCFMPDGRYRGHNVPADRREGRGRSLINIQARHSFRTPAEEPTLFRDLDRSPRRKRKKASEQCLERDSRRAPGYVKEKRRYLFSSGATPPSLPSPLPYKSLVSCKLSRSEIDLSAKEYVHMF